MSSKNEFKEKQVLLLQGRAGSGKSTFAHMLYQNLLDNWTTGKSIPILLYLPSITSASAYLKSLARADFKNEWLEKNNFIIILESFDELR